MHLPPGESGIPWTIPGFDILDFRNCTLAREADMAFGYDIVWVLMNFMVGCFVEWAEDPRMLTAQAESRILLR